MDSQDAINQREWETPDNWSRRLGVLVYESALDTRLWVPKHNPQLGWTLNFAHRAGYWTLIGFSIVPLGFLLLALLVAISRHHQ